MSHCNIIARASGESKYVSPKLLVLLDMNGTIILRSDSKVKSKQPEFRHNEKYYYIRDYAKSLIMFLLENREFIQIAFYTSMRYENAAPCVQSLVDEELYRDIYIYDRKFNKDDPLKRNKWDTMRNLPQLWAAEDTPAYGFTEYSTLMIDDSLSKMRDYPDNCLLIPEYTKERASSDAEDTTLLTLINCLSEIVYLWKQGHEDIRIIMQAKSNFFREKLH